MRSKDQILLEEIYTNLKENEQMEFPNMESPTPAPVENEVKEPNSQQIEKIKSLISQKGAFKTARILLNFVLNKEIQLGLNDLADDSTVSSVVEDIESYLEDGDVEGAWQTAKNSVEEIMSNQF